MLIYFEFFYQEQFQPSHVSLSSKSRGMLINFDQKQTKWLSKYIQVSLIGLI